MTFLSSGRLTTASPKASILKTRRAMSWKFIVKSLSVPGRSRTRSLSPIPSTSKPCRVISSWCMLRRPVSTKPKEVALMKLLVGWSRVTFLGLLVLSLGLTLILTRSGNAQAQKVLRVGLAEDPDILDPTLARTFVGRIVFAALCDKLADIDENLNIVPQLATSYQWSPDNKALTLTLRQGVTFHDGEKFDAAAVKYNIERHKNMAGSNRRGELAPGSSVDVIDAATV